MKQGFAFHQTLDDTPENREAMFQEMLKFDEPYLQPGMKRNAPPFFLGVTTRRGVLAFMTGPDAVTSLTFVIAEWSPWSGLKRVDLPVSQIRWVKHL